MCVVVDDVSPVVATLTIDGVAVALSTAAPLCGEFLPTFEGNHTIVATAVDAAGNPCVSPAVAWLVVDFTPPSCSLTRVDVTGCATSDSLTACSTPSSSVFSVACVQPIVPHATAPCFRQWLLQPFTSAASCSLQVTLPSSASAWATLPADAAPLSLVPPVAAFTATNAVARFVLFTRAVDAAGNAGDVSAYEWWVDTLPPSPPVVVSGPDAVGLATLSIITLRLVGNTAPGHVRFDYVLTADGAPYSVPGSGNPAIAVPSPSNDDPVVLSLSGLAADHAYAVTLAAVSQSGLRSTNTTTVSWIVLSSAPSVIVTRQPDAVSGSARPSFHFVADWGASSLGVAGEGNLTFQTRLVGDSDLDGYHTPPLCDYGHLDAATQRDCVDAGCAAAGCNYSVSLALPRGSSFAYSLQVRARLYSSTGRPLTLQWTYLRCRTDEYAVFSGVDAIACEPCPLGGDCTGDALPAAELVPDGVLASVVAEESEVVDGGNAKVVAASAVVQQKHITARPGYWAPDDSDGLTFYECPAAYACLQGGNGSRAQCAQGYSGVLCTVCAPGYFQQYGYCVLCTYLGWSG